MSDSAHFDDFDRKWSQRDLSRAIGWKRVVSWDADSRTLRALYEVRPEFCHSGGTIAQGGFVTAWLDASMAQATMRDTNFESNIATLELKVSFLKAVPPGDVLAEEDGWLRIGALVRHGDLERSDLVRERYPIIHDAAQHVADPLIRNRGTFCGSLAHGDPAGDWATVAATLGAELHAVGPDGAVVHSARGFQTSMFETQLGTDQILVEARVPAPKPGQGSAYLKVERKVGDYAAAAVGVMVVLDGDTITEASIGLTNVGPETIHATAAGDALVGKSIADAAALEAAGTLAMEASDPSSDLRGPAEYKQDLVRVLTKRALRTAGARAQGKEA